MHYSTGLAKSPVRLSYSMTGGAEIDFGPPPEISLAPGR